MLSDNDPIPITVDEFPLLVLYELMPENKQLREFVGANSALWRTRPFPHEAWMLQVFAYLLEKGEKNITEDDGKKISRLLQHIAELTDGQIIAEKPKERTAPSFLNEQLRGEMRIISEQIGEGSYFKEINNWQKHLIGVFRHFYNNLAENKIFSVKIIDFEKEIRQLKNSKS